MFLKIKNRVINKYYNAIFAPLAFKTKRKLLVIESDDWGSIRMPNKSVYNKLLKAGLAVDQSKYTRFDSLASIDDLSLLFDTLKQFKDINGQHPVITANAVVANPDFERIRQSNFAEYHHEKITDTFARYPNHSIEIWKAGIGERIFFSTVSWQRTFKCFAMDKISTKRV